jgi:flagellar basal body L-ring protein FlgH
MTGCVTHELREKIRSDASYTEEISSVLMSEDGKKLVFIGDDYHYIFDAPVGLSQSLRSSFQKSLFASFKEFRVDKNDNITGNITISLDESASQQDKEEAIRLGYDKQSVSPVLELSLQGKRYKSGGVTTDRVGYKLNYTYKVPVLEGRSSLEKAALTAATPITVLADGVLVIGGSTLIILLGVTPH